MKTEKLQKILANLGLASRREIERWIMAGCIKLNHKIAKLGDRATPTDKIYLDGRLIRGTVPFGDSPHSAKILIYHKPVGEICTRSDPQNRTTVFDHLPKLKKGRWIAVGRLDFNSSGLLLFTNNGELANQMMHPSSQLEREYKVRVLGELTSAQMQQLKKGVKLKDGIAHFKKIKPLSGKGANRWYQVVLTEGRNREVRRLFESQKIQVNRLVRVRFGDFILPKNLPAGNFKQINL